MSGSLRLSPVAEGSLSTFRGRLRTREEIDLLHKSLTVIIVPQTHRRTLYLRIPMLALLLAGAAAALLVFVSAMHLYDLRLHLHRADAVVRERDALARLTENQQQEIAARQADLSRLVSAVKRFELEQLALRELELKVRGLLGGSGGPTGATVAPVLSEEAPSPEDALDRLGALAAEQTQRAGSLASAASDLESHVAYLRARPSGWPAAGGRTDGYGWRWDPFDGGRAFHEGIDIAGTHGSAISARADGVVVFSDWKAGGYGQTVIIDHGYGFQTLYAHTSQNLAQVGDTVQRGDVIAKMGSTGKSTGPHVHYEVLRWGQAVDPTPYLNE